MAIMTSNQETTKSFVRVYVCACGFSTTSFEDFKNHREHRLRNEKSLYATRLIDDIDYDTNDRAGEFRAK